jgi:putative addiction module killer protein
LAAKGNPAIEAATDLCGVIEIREYVDARWLERLRRSPFARWFDRLPAEAAAKVTTAVARLSQGYRTNISGVGEGVLERTIDWGPGYRVYFARDGDDVIIPLGGGTKKDIKLAKERWADYRKRRHRQRSKRVCR